MRPPITQELGFGPDVSPHVTPISIAESTDLRNKLRTLQNDWKQVVAQAVSSAKVTEALEPRVKDLEQKLKTLDEIVSKLQGLHEKIDEMAERTTALESKKRKK